MKYSHHQTKYIGNQVGLRTYLRPEYERFKRCLWNIGQELHIQMADR